MTPSTPSLASSASRPVTRGRWEYHRVETWAGVETGAWQLDGLDWWLRRRTGAAQSLRWCSYCWREPYSWWQLHAAPPGEWLTLTPPSQWAEYGRRDRGELFAWPPGWEPGHGHCTHRHLLRDAMKAAEAALAEKVLKALGG